MFRKLVIGLLPLFFVLLAIGCARKEDQNDKIVFSVLTPDQHTITPTGTIDKAFGGADGQTVIEKHVPYANGDRGHVFYRGKNGSVKSVREEYSDDRNKSVAMFSDNGKNVVNGQVWRPDGTLYLETRALADGCASTDYYAVDGKWLFLNRHRSVDGATWNDVLLRQDGSVWAKTSWQYDGKSAKHKWIELYDKDTAKKLFLVEYAEEGQFVTYFNKNGTAVYRQFHRNSSEHFDEEEGSEWQADPYATWHLEQIEEFDGSGKVLRTLSFKEEEGTVTLLFAKVGIFQGNSKVASGYVVKTYSPKEGAKETLIEKVYVPPDQTAELQRLTQPTTMTKLEKPGGYTEEHKPAENLEEALPLDWLRRPVLGEVEFVRNKLNSQNKEFLGNRDDSDPCRWYLKP